MSKEIERAIAFAEEYRKRLVSYIEFGEAKRGETKLNEWETILFSLQALLDREKEPCGWISVKDRLPPRYIGIIACVSNDTMNGIDFGCLNSSNQWDLKSGFYDFERVAHWMPRPELPPSQPTKTARIIDDTPHPFSAGSERYACSACGVRVRRGDGKCSGCGAVFEEGDND